jgi:L-aminopeptidase/D-esterase-like protein
MTGVTAVLTESGAVGGIDIRGTAAGTRQVDSLSPLHVAGVVHAVTFSGGSAFGLSASGGVMKFLEEKGIGIDVFYVKVPIVPSAIIFDLGIGDPMVRPDAEMGYNAAANAKDGPVEQGSVGVGTGASVGKLNGPGFAMKGGVGTASESFTPKNGGEEIVVGALVVVNAFGDVLDPKTCEIIAGARDPEDPERFINTSKRLRNGEDRTMPPGQNTTLAVIATNALLEKQGAIKLAQMAQTSLGKAISPFHSTFDGDVTITLSVNNGAGSVGINTLGMLGETALLRAVERAIMNADGRGIIPSYSDLNGKR